MDSTVGALPDRIGPYRILRLLGEGGMGRVYLAEQDAPHRQVALKVLRAAAASGDYAARFRREIELLAALEHPGIARIYAAGSAGTDAGSLPYLAMEYVRGTDLATHVQAQALDLESRLRLIAQLCRAVHHAHTRGVIHRDLKPGNILVDETGQPKILDFGVARAIGNEALTRMTAAGEIIGTLPYMSWEQLTGDARALDPRADVYSLGAIAYELLGGRLPYPDLPKQTLLSAIDTVRRQDPARLSRLLPAAAGDVDTIVMKALAREPEARYGSAAEMAADIERYLARLPIAARPPTTRYVVGLFVRRHRTLAAAGIAVMLAVVAAALVSLRFAFEARSRLVEREAVSGFLEQMLTAADPQRALGEKLTVLDVLEVARVELDANRALAPQAVAQLRRTLGNTYVGLGRAAEGLAQLQQARAAYGDSGAGDSVEVLEVELDIVAGLKEAGREAEAQAAAAALSARLPARGGDAHDLRARTQLQQADILIRLGDPAQAETLLRGTLAALQSRLGSGHALTLQVQDRLSYALHHLARFDESLALSQEVARQLAAELGADHPRVQDVNEIVAVNLRELARYDEAEAVYRQTVAARERVLGRRHPQTAVALSGYAAVVALAGRPQQALADAVEAHDSLLARLGADAEMTRNAASLRAYVASETGDYAQAAQINRELIAQSERKPGGPSVTDLPDYNNLANQLLRLDRVDEACSTFARLLEQAARIIGKEHAHYGMFENNYGECLRKRGDLAGARAALEHSRSVLEATLEPGHPHRQRVIERLRAVYQALGLKDQLAALPAAPP